MSLSIARPLSVLVFVLVLPVAACAAPQAAPSQTAAPAAPSGPTWAMTGLMADACQCRVFCPCEFSSTPSEGRCDDMAILHIDKGHYGDVTLDGLSIVVASQSPQGERMVDNIGKLTFARLYVSKTVGDPQAKALAEVARRVLGTFVKNASRISPDEQVKRVDLTVATSLKESSARIPGILDLRIEALPGGDPTQPIAIKNSPWSAPGVGDALVGHSTAYTYTDEGRSWSYAGRSASTRTLQLSAPIAPPPEGH